MSTLCTDSRAKYLHCGLCLRDRPDNQSPQEYARLNAYVLDGAIHLECVRHGQYVGSFGLSKRALKEFAQELNGVCSGCGLPHSEHDHA